MLYPAAAQCAVLTRVNRAGSSAEALLDHAMGMNKFETEQDSIGEIIILPREQAVLMTYYRNNIHHMLVMPSLIAAIVQQHREISEAERCARSAPVYPMLKSELFLRWDSAELPALLNALCAEMARQGLITVQEGQLKMSAARYRTRSCWPGFVKRCSVSTFAILSADH